MSKAKFVFYVIHSNPTYEGVPRLFLCKYLNNKKSWAVELDEYKDLLLKTEFKEDEAEVWGTIEKIIDANQLDVRLEDNTVERAEFSKNMLWKIETLMMEHHAIARVHNEVFPMRVVDRSKVKDAVILEAELSHFKKMNDQAHVYAQKQQQIWQDDHQMVKMRQKTR